MSGFWWRVFQCFVAVVLLSRRVPGVLVGFGVLVCSGVVGVGVKAFWWFRMLMCVRLSCFWFCFLVCFVWLITGCCVLWARVVVFVVGGEGGGVCLWGACAFVGRVRLCGVCLWGVCVCVACVWVACVCGV